ncbi:hypothetical protein MJO29_011798 [Puccinia striiformis f. sp. tritici]|nr:hypothetical protein MJO29_011798 [Puccinia striiformis f. sp. tritici]
MYSTKFILLLIAITLSGRAVNAADPAFDPSEFPCPDPKQSKAMCLQTTVKSAKQRTDWFRKLFFYSLRLLLFLDRGVLIEVFCISQIFLVIPANLATLNPPLPPQYSCDSQRQIFQSGFHNTCCSKDLDLKKFPKSVGLHLCDIFQLDLHDHLAKLDRGTFGIHHRPSIISVDSFNRSFSSLNCSTGSKPRLNSLLSGAINTQPPPPATPTSVNYSNLGSSATGPNHLLISTPDLMTCDSPPFFPASATLEPRPSLADRLSSKGKKKNPPFQLHSPDQLPFSSRPVSPRTKNILDGIGIENHNSRIDIENDLEITTGFGPCPAAETAPPRLRTSGLTFKPPHDQRSRSHTPPHQQRSQSSSCTQLDSRRRLSTSRPQRHSFTSSSTTSQACNLIIVRSHNPVFPLGSTSSALFTSSPSNLLIGPSSQKQTIHSPSQSHSSSECPSHSHSVFLKEHGDAKTLVGDHSDSGTKTKKLAVDPQSPRPIIVTNPRPDLNKLIKPLSSLHPTNQITPTPPSASPSDLPADSNTITPISAPSCMTTAPRTTKKTDRHSQVDTGFSKSDTTPLFFIDAPEERPGNVPWDYSEVCEAEDRLLFHCKTMGTSFLPTIEAVVDLGWKNVD